MAACLGPPAARRHPGGASLDRLSRSLSELIGFVGPLHRRGVGFKSVHETLDTTTADGRLVFHVFAVLAEFIPRVDRRGHPRGIGCHPSPRHASRPALAMTAEQILHVPDLVTRPDNTVSSIARLLGVSRATIYKHVLEVTTRRVAAALPPGQE